MDAKLSTLLDMRMEGEITPEEYTVKRAELHDRQSALRLQFERSDRDYGVIANLAVKAL